MKVEKSKIKFQDISQNFDIAQTEQKIIDYWKENKIFEKSVENKKGDKVYSFYDGPPFITGLPHYGSLLSSVVKDVVLRFWTMKGYKIRRVWGWDCHGLPAETAVEKLLGLKSKRDIEKMGVDNFIKECRTFVSKTSSEWGWYVDHIGRWVDFENSYKTMDQNYMESVIWVFKQLYEKGYIYKGKRVSLFCPRCSTPLSKFEITMDEGSYRDVVDPAITIKFKLKGENDKYVLAWTTTPWTLPSNFALAVDPKQTYVEVEKNGEKIILASKRYQYYFEKEKIIRKFSGTELVGLEYEPLYEYFKKGNNDYKIYPAPFVTTSEGTGIVHIAPGFGEDDTALGEQFGISMADSVDEEGCLVEKVEKFAGLFIKKADAKVIEELRERNLLFKEEKITHSYPFCYRCDSPLLYKAQVAWYVSIEKIKNTLLETNKNIHWFPSHFKYGRFANNIKSAPDWCISRTRYWGTALPVWECDCGAVYVFGSIKEIEEASGEKIVDLHRPEIDKVTVKCKCGKEAKRVKEVLDCWMESGAMPYGQWHYPFEHKEDFEKGFPTDFIAEYTGQLRAWFYYLHVLSNILFGRNCFKNAIVTGVVLGSDGKKMSKSKGNYPDPKEVMIKYGGDAVRLYLVNSQVVAGNDISVSEEGIAEQVRTVILPLWNCFRYFITFAQLHNFEPDSKQSDNVIDLWIESRLQSFVKDCSGSFEKYNLQKASEKIFNFVDDLSRWYIRRSRERFQLGDKQALNTLYQILVNFSLVIAPILPFITEEIYQNLTKELSVHLAGWPKVQKNKINSELENQMILIRQICELGNSERKASGIKNRQPLRKLEVKNLSTDLSDGLLELIKDELNVKEVVTSRGSGNLQIELDKTITQELKEEGEARDIIRKIQEERKNLGCDLKDRVIVYLPSWPKRMEEEIKNKTLANEIIVAENFEVKKTV